jgi:uncharacterized membrane protein YczE
MKPRRNPFLLVQTASAFAFGLFFVVLSFLAHPANVSFALPILVIGLVLVAAGVAALLFGVLRPKR